jgi:hypothetical protein
MKKSKKKKVKQKAKRKPRPKPEVRKKDEGYSDPPKAFLDGFWI